MRTFGKLTLAFGMVALMAAPAWAQGRGFGMGGGTMLLSNKGVQKEIKATDDQAKKLDAFATEMMEKQREAFQGFQDLSQEERLERRQKMQAEVQKGLANILKPDQVKRFDQISLQTAGVNAFSTPRVQEALKLSDDQKSKIREITEETTASMREIFQGFQDDREGAMKKMAELRKTSTAKVVALLNDSQKGTWKEQTGEPYEVKFEPPRQN
jgi:Spy/CpxP family protein refolding chaperone